jgi:hypothetical protein
MTTGTLAPTRAVEAALGRHSDDVRLDPRPNFADAAPIRQIQNRLTRGLLIVSIVSVLLALAAAYHPVESTNPLQSPLDWVASLKSVPHRECDWGAHVGSTDWYACEVQWEGWKVLLYGAGNKITHAYLRPPFPIPLGDLVRWYGRWNKAIHYRHLHHLVWDQLEVYLYVSKGVSVSVMSSQVKQLQVKL